MMKRSIGSIAETRRYGLYGRVSTASQEENGTSIESQINAGKEFIARAGGRLHPGHVYTDAASGASWRERPALQALLAAVRTGEIDVVLVHALDRLSRNQQHVAVIVDIVEDAGAQLEAVTEDFEQSAIGRFLRNAKAFVAEVEREKIIERTVRGKLTRVRSGKVHNHANELYGYRREKTLGVREIFEPEAVVVRRIFHMAANENSIRSISTLLNAEHIPSPASSKGMNYGRPTYWGSGVVRRILQEPSYKGEGVVWRWRRIKGGVELRPEHEWIHLPPSSTPIIVTSEIWDIVQDRLGRNHGNSKRNAERPYLLRGLLVCGVCGRKMRSNVERNGLRVYRCSSRETPNGPCGGKRTRADAVEEWAWQEMKNILGQRDLIEAEIASRQAAGPDPALERVADKVPLWHA